MNVDELMNQTITAVGAHWRAQGKTLTGFLGLAGAKYDRELMIVGRAVNGWSEFTVERLADAGARRAFVTSLREHESACPLSWVNAPAQPGVYNARRSAFWRTARKVREALTGEPLADDSWASHLAWSNLYKISNDTGNPPDWMCTVQENQCIEMLGKEIDQFRPKRVLFSTGLDWAMPFVKALGRFSTIPSPRYGEATGRISGGGEMVPCVVAAHPMTKPEEEWVSDVLNAFKKA